MEINFKGPVMPIDPYSQLAFVEILNIILTAGHIVDVNRFLINRNVNPQFGSLSQSAIRLAVRLFQMVVRRRPFHPLAAHGLQFNAVFQPQDTRSAIRYPGGERQRERL